MRWIVLSDTHGNSRAILDILEAEPAAAGFIHLGDMAADMAELACLTDRPVLQVAGNCDHLSDLPQELELVMGSTRTLLTHGHLYGVKGGTARLTARALARQCPLVLFGHTHLPAVVRTDAILMVNPGTLMATASSRSYARIHLSSDGPTPELVTL